MPRLTERARVLRSLKVMKQLEEVDELLLSVNGGLQLVDNSPDSSAAESDTDMDTDADTDSEDSGSSIDSDNESSNSDSEMFVLQTGAQCNWGGLYDQLSQLRYWEDRENPRLVYMNRTHTVEQWFEQRCSETPAIFRAHFRMSRDSFEALLNAIEDHPVFYNQSRTKQTPVRYQLAVFLYCFGSNSSQLLCASVTGVGEGSVRNYTSRCITAILSLRDTYIRCPTQEEKAVMKQQIFAASMETFSGCVGFVGGTFITLSYAPLEDWWFSHNQESSYAPNSLVVCNDRRRITYLRTGDISAVPDARVFASSQLHLFADRFFDEGEYLIGDSAYTLTDYMVTPFKEPVPSRYHNAFNAMLSSQHIVIEDVFGLIKARFPSVTNVSIRIEGTESHRAVVRWFETACVLHNFLLDTDDGEWDNDDDRALANIHQEKVKKAKAIIEQQEDLLPGDEAAGVRLRGALLKLFIENVDENDLELL
ncbi:Similar to Putative nuclease HARBI1; acc. no. Q96MB7 [Pyronema omphalodes CBS 100304]|uniref:Similar to Putative nuclease HARBI1 acc. no. Q96MB7 n=1 Tax=Pyronema omphalodes (strain CBS 100304) TaxID=1076935 RepID=U4LVJ1_PYROM|nr:Similar to Putative nuclease HARBI1; acc. no. Q96MB7 [Pyronema omphalodes CBS 100304]